MSSTQAVSEPASPVRPRNKPLSRQNERRLLRAMQDRAESGDLEAAERLIRLAREQRRAAAVRPE
jgi:hypothetical protein